jgi:hypothetical protein
MRVSVSLRGENPGAQHFLAEFEIAIGDGGPAPIEYEGRRYVFSHKLVAHGYRSSGSEEIYVFTEARKIRGFPDGG